jgi:arginine/ornithine N-succinyltransferase beta subunit
MLYSLHDNCPMRQFYVTMTHTIYYDANYVDMHETNPTVTTLLEMLRALREAALINGPGTSHG